MVFEILAEKKVSNRITLYDPTGSPSACSLVPPAQMKVREARLLDQKIAERRSLIEATFGLLYSGLTIHNIIRHHLPFRLGLRRSTEWWLVDFDTYERNFPFEVGHYEAILNDSRTLRPYPGLIPDAALEKYREAQKTKLFDHFLVVEPKYGQKPRPTPDPWLLGHFNAEFAVLAYWD